MNQIYKTISAAVLISVFLFIGCKKSTDQNTSNTLDSNVKKSSLPIADIDSNVYKTVVIGNQVWMAENLNVVRYRNGDTIPQVKDSADWAVLKTGAWCYYENSTKNGKVYGKLYNWYAVNDPRGLAPKGWHIPTDADWKKIDETFGGHEVAGGKMKSTELWTPPNTGASNSTGFSSLPAGIRRFSGEFDLLGTNCYFWSSTEANDKNVWARLSYFNNAELESKYYLKNFAYSVRCIKD